jgi:hypothetical protein
MESILVNMKRNIWLRLREKDCQDVASQDQKPQLTGVKNSKLT